MEEYIDIDGTRKIIFKDDIEFRGCLADAISGEKRWATVIKDLVPLMFSLAIATTSLSIIGNVINNK
ncbi:hypothetical protein M0R04_09030 [Candidatus Dojkabacteria bacterium]|jgi:hypothetical protein|nr:hypothetical protein [Candidatus Dojkabacteria bacterium]